MTTMRPTNLTPPGFTPVSTRPGRVIVSKPASPIAPAPPEAASSLRSYEITWSNLSAGRARVFSATIDPRARSITTPDRVASFATPTVDARGLLHIDEPGVLTATIRLSDGMLLYARLGPRTDPDERTRGAHALAPTGSFLPGS